MKNRMKTLLIAMLVIPVMMLLTACGNAAEIADTIYETVLLAPSGIYKIDSMVVGTQTVVTGGAVTQVGYDSYFSSQDGITNFAEAQAMVDKSPFVVQANMIYLEFYWGSMPRTVCYYFIYPDGRLDLFDAGQPAQIREDFEKTDLSSAKISYANKTITMNMIGDEGLVDGTVIYKLA